MTLLGSGYLGLNAIYVNDVERSVEHEVFGSSTYDKSLQECSDATQPPVGGLGTTWNLPDDWYDHTQVNWGGCYGEQALGNPFSQSVWIKRITQGSLYEVPTTQTTATLEFNGNQNESTRLYKDSGGTTDFVAGDHLVAQVYRREIGVGSWGSVLQTYVDYTNESYAMTFDTYEYKWLVTQGA